MLNIQTISNLKIIIFAILLFLATNVSSKETVSSGCKFKAETEKNSQLIEMALGSEAEKCVTFPYLSKYTKPEPVMPLFHAGVDLQANNQAVSSVTNGKVMSACEAESSKTACKDSMGIIMIATNVKGVESRVIYVHMSQSLVKVGDTVDIGQPLGTSGNRFGGDPNGAGDPHLHIEVRPNYSGLSAVGRMSCGGPETCITKEKVAAITIDPALVIDSFKPDSVSNSNTNSQRWVLKNQPNFILTPGSLKDGFRFTKDGEVSYRGQVLKDNPKLAKQYFSGDDSIHIYYSPENTKALLIYNTKTWGGIFASLVDLKNQKVLMREIVNSHGVGLNGVSWSALGEYLAFAYVSELETQFELAILETKGLDLYRLKPLNAPENAGFIPKQDSIKWRDNTTIQVDFDMSIVNYSSTGEPALQKSYATTVLQKLSKDNNPWIVQDNPNYKLKPGEIKNNFKFNNTGEVIFGGKVLFPKTKRLDKYSELKVYVSPNNPSKALVAFRDWDYGVLRAAIVDLNNKTIISNQLIPESSVRGVGSVNILTISDTAFSWSQNGQYVAMSISPAEFQANLAVVNLNSGKINQYSPTGLKGREVYSPDMQSIKWRGSKSLQFNFDYYIYKDNEDLVRDYSATETIANTDLPSNFKINQGGGSKDKPLSPPKNYQHWGACPFECCVYREWIAMEPIKLYQTRDERSKVVANLIKNETVLAITGVVVTHKVGKAKILLQIQAWENSKSNSPNELTINKGEIIYPLHYEGEGYSAFWYNGKVYSAELINTKQVNIEQEYQYDWWAQIKNKSGKVGWTKQTNVFAQQDACG